MTEYIEREAAKKAIMDYMADQTVSKYASSAECRAARSGAEGAFNEIDDLPAADVVEVRHGKWELGFKFNEYYWITDAFMKCSCCGYVPNQFGEYKTFKFCPECGAKMDLEE